MLVKKITKEHISPLKIIDQIGRTVDCPTVPKRIISCVPSITEYLLDILPYDRIVGRTKFCIHPTEKVQAIEKIGGTKNLNLQRILALKPDLIIANKEENIKETIAFLMPKTNVYVSDVKDSTSALKMMKDIAMLVQKEEKYHFIEESYNQWYSILTKNRIKLSYLYLIWKDPFMTIGVDTYIHHKLSLCGFQNIYSDQCRYPMIENIDDAVSKADVVFLSDEPYPFDDSHVSMFQESYPNKIIMLVNGSYLSWYGSRMLKGLEYMNDMIIPALNKKLI